MKTSVKLKALSMRLFGKILKSKPTIPPKQSLKRSPTAAKRRLTRLCALLKFPGLTSAPAVRRTLKGRAKSARSALSKANATAAEQGSMSFAASAICLTRAKSCCKTTLSAISLSQRKPRPSAWFKSLRRKGLPLRLRSPRSNASFPH